jgi:hypothetical protein
MISVALIFVHYLSKNIIFLLTLAAKHSMISTSLIRTGEAVICGLSGVPPYPSLIEKRRVDITSNKSRAPKNSINPG